MKRHFSLMIAAVLLAACATPAPAPTPLPPPQKLRLATTTSTADTGLLDAILPDFQQKFNAKVDTIAVGTGQAIELGAKGDVDVVLVHARASEDKFVADGDGINRLDVMYNDFVLVGAKEDPAKVKDMTTAKDAFVAISKASATFASRGDNSGTHSKEKSVWAAAQITPGKEMSWYLSIGQGMGETLLFANEKKAYTLADRGTWLSQKSKLPNLIVVVGGETINDNKDKTLLNPYGVIPVNPQKHSGVNFDLATKFANWITSAETQKKIGEYGKDKFGQALFYPGK